MVTTNETSQVGIDGGRDSAKDLERVEKQLRNETGRLRQFKIKSTGYPTVVKPPFSQMAQSLPKGFNAFKHSSPGTNTSGKYTTSKIIPQYTLQSREDLYEQNMQTKMQVNGLKTENRKIHTKLLQLEQ